MSTTQRRKTDKEKSTTTGSKGTAAANADDLTEQLNRAQSAVEASYASTQTLHSQWRTQLLRMAYLVMVVTLHMAQTPSSTCVKNIKQFNRENPEFGIPGTQVIGIVLYDSIVEMLSIICAVFIVLCLRLPNTGDDFSSLPYRLSCILLPMIITLHFQRKMTNQDDGTTTSNTTATSSIANCVAGFARSMGDHERIKALESDDHNNNNNNDATPRHFPVILIFHTVVSISLWFMQYQNRQFHKNIDMVQKLKEELNQAKTARVDKKKR